MLEDYDLIVASFQSQYGLRLSKELPLMSWAEFCQLLAGIGPDTPLGRIVAIRAERDKDTLKYFTKEQHRIRNAWRSRHKAKTGKAELEAFLAEMQQAFVAMAGGERHG